ncbi:MAG: UDP-N-acetylmuramoyl-tripeptide--D-alanyl-D-alanine ligase [Actinomycetaceae bacterium]|nr:UDP-N-acetylmuramoyl-tripeptide--D-alanyl-D-alanine ligase [Actinomycetaceae bacterium]
MTYSAEWIASEVNGRLEGDNVQVTGGVFTDSRACQEGSLYIARIGESLDGHDFIESAIDNGAVCAIVTNPEAGPGDLPRIVVDDATRALGLLARAHLKRLRHESEITVVGITGSVGKTTTKDLTARVLQTFGPTVAPESSFNNEVGMPLTVLKATEETRYLVLEMGASGAGHLQYLTSIAAPDVAVELAVGKAHLGGFGSVDKLARAKAELVEGLYKGGTAILNMDDKNVANMAELTNGPVLYFSAKGNSKADVRATHIRLNDESCPHFDLEAGDVLKRVKLRLVGRHQVTNALAAISVCLDLGLDPRQVVDAINGFEAVSPHRMHVFESSGALIIDDSYNANPDSMRAGLEVLARLGERAPRRVAVLGEMLELGQSSPTLHRDVGELADQAHVDLLITVGPGAREIANPMQGRAECHHFDDADEAATLVKEIVRPEDVVFIKGSQYSGVWRIADEFIQK